MFHSDLNYDIVRMRQEELVGRATGSVARRMLAAGARWSHGCRRGAEPVPRRAPPSDSPSAASCAVPPPRHDANPPVTTTACRVADGRRTLVRPLGWTRGGGSVELMLSGRPG